jgi:hypothetical protein
MKNRPFNKTTTAVFHRLLIGDQSDECSPGRELSSATTDAANTAACAAPNPAAALRNRSVCVGVIVVVGGVAKFIPGGLGTGGALCFFGVLLFLLTLIRLPGLPDTEPPLSWFEKVTGIFYEPTRVFRNLRIHPLWPARF